jgi:excisionase family DNA binding protein
MTIRSAGEAYPDIGERMFRRLTERAELPYSRVGNRKLIAEDEIEAYLESRRVEPISCRSRPRPAA